MRGKLQATADDRIKRSKHCEEALNKIQSAMINIIGSTDKTRSNVTHSVQKIFSKSTSQNLRAARGFGMDPGSTFYQHGRPGASSTRRKMSGSTKSKRK